MSTAKIKNLMAHVKHVLRVMPMTRNSDVELTIQIWKLYRKEFIVELSDGTEAVRLKDLFELPREDNVKRCRAKIQNEEGLYLPTDQAVAEARGIEEEKWRAAMGYPAGRSV